jgi:hypothetical protein
MKTSDLAMLMSAPFIAVGTTGVDTKWTHVYAVVFLTAMVVFMFLERRD